MANLSDLQVAMLLEEIAFAMRVGTPVADSMRRLEDRRLGGIAKAAGLIAAGLDRGEDISQAFRHASDRTSAQAAAAILASQKCGQPGLMQRVARQLRRRNQISRETQIAWIYPWMLMALGYAVAVAVMAPLIRRIHGDGIQWPAWIAQVARWLEFNWWLPPAMALVLFVVFLGWLFARSRFPRHARLQLFCDSLADQLAYGISEDVAIESAAEISGDRDLIAVNQPSLKSPSIARVLSHPGSRLLGGDLLSAESALIARLRYVASIHGEQARNHSYIWARLVPRITMIVFGGGLTLAYAWWVIAPVYVQVAQW